MDPNATFPGIASVGVPHRAPSIPPAPFPPQPQPQPQPQWHPPLATARASPAAVRSILQEIYHAPLTIPAGSYDAGGAMEIALSSPPILGEAVLADVFGADKEEKQGGAQHADGGSGGY